MKAGKRMALGGMLSALGTTVMLMGGVVPLATFCCPMLAAVMLVPIEIECGRKFAWASWAAVAFLSLILCADKEAALVYLFIGYYPMLRRKLNGIGARGARIAAKLGVFNLAIGIMYTLSILVLRMEAILRDYQEMGVALTLVCLLIGNATILMFDRLLGILERLYCARLRKRLL